MFNDVVITSMGVVSPIGGNLSRFKDNLFSGQSGIKNIRGSIVPQSFPVPYAGVVDAAELLASEYFSPDELTKKSALYSVIATEECLRDFPEGLSFDAIVYATSESVNFENVRKTLKEYDFSQIDSYKNESILERIKFILSKKKLTGINDENSISINGACASGNQVIGIAYQRIRSGQWMRAIVGGVDARCESANFLNFNLLSALTTEEIDPSKASCPFSLERCGFVRGEGAGTLVMESRQSAIDRGATILATVSGYGNTSDGYRLTDGREDAKCVVRAMSDAIKTANIMTNEIDYINAHGTSTNLNDRLETFAIKEVFGSRAKKIPVSSLKSQTGHSTVAAGILEAVASVMMLNEQRVAPTINYQTPDPDCDLDYVPNISRPHKINYILSNNFGFGGQNSCLVFKRELK